MAAKKAAKMGHTKGGRRGVEAGTTPVYGRFVIRGGGFNYTVVDTENEVEPRGGFGMWEAINLRDRFNTDPEFVASEARLDAEVREAQEAELEFEVPPGRELTDEEIAELPILDPEVLS